MPDDTGREVPLHGQPAELPARSRRWVGPTVFLAVVLAAVLVLIFSNTEATPLRFAGDHRTGDRLRKIGIIIPGIELVSSHVQHLVSPAIQPPNQLSLERKASVVRPKSYSLCHYSPPPRSRNAVSATFRDVRPYFS